MRSKKEIPVEEKSYAALFFILSALLGFVTLWGFWNEAITRRPWKAIQQRFYQYEYEKTKIALEGAQKELPEIETPEPLDAKRLSKLEQNINDATIKLDEAIQERKFLQSEADAINYKYQFALHHSKAIHEKGDKSDPEVDKWKSRLDDYDRQIEGKLTQDVVAAERTLADAYLESASFYEAGGHIEDALSQFLLVQKYDPASETLPAKIKDLRLQVESIRADRVAKAEVDKLEEKLSSLSPLKRSFLGSLLESPFHKTRSLVQYYLEDFEYTADRCATCHFSVDRSGYDRFAAESFEVEGGDEGQKPSKQLMHPLVKVGSESILIDDEEGGKRSVRPERKRLTYFCRPRYCRFWRGSGNRIRNRLRRCAANPSLSGCAARQPSCGEIWLYTVPRRARTSPYGTIRSCLDACRVLAGTRVGIG